MNAMEKDWKLYYPQTFPSVIMTAMTRATIAICNVAAACAVKHASFSFPRAVTFVGCGRVTEPLSKIGTVPASDK